MQEFQQRVITEKKELNDKIDKLNKFFKTSIYSSLPDIEQEHLCWQLYVMLEYTSVLGRRIALFK